MTDSFGGCTVLRCPVCSADKSREPTPMKRNKPLRRKLGGVS